MADTLQVTVVEEPELVWSNDKGDIKLYAVVLDVGGKRFKAKTYSAAIATKDWSGEVEKYTKQGSQGEETFIRQPKKAGGYGGGRGGGQPMDPTAMYTAYAKDILVAMIMTSGYKKADYDKHLSEVKRGGQVLAGQDNPAPATSDDETEEQL